MRRTWRSMSKSGSSTHNGAPSAAGFGCTRQPRRGKPCTAASTRVRRRSKSGARSRIVTEPNVDDRNGSFSTRHISASASLIRRSATVTFDAARSSAMGQACHDFSGSLRRTLRIGRGNTLAPIAFATDPSRYRHWDLAIDGPIATLAMRVAPDGGLGEGYDLKLNSYDLGVDIELYDATQRLRFEHPGVKAVVVTSGIEKV